MERPASALVVARSLRAATNYRANPTTISYGASTILTATVTPSVATGTVTFLDNGISIGASFHFTIDLLFTSITISVSISLGGTVVVEGPPLRGTVTVELELARA